MQDDNYTSVDDKKTGILSKAAVAGASIAMVGGGYYYLQTPTTDVKPVKNAIKS